jgi:hypothetical protein
LPLQGDAKTILGPRHWREHEELHQIGWKLPLHNFNVVANGLRRIMGKSDDEPHTGRNPDRLPSQNERPVDWLPGAAGFEHTHFGIRIPYALETDWPVGAVGFEPLHFRIGIREDSQPGAAGFELTHLN